MDLSPFPQAGSSPLHSSHETDFQTIVSHPRHTLEDSGYASSNDDEEHPAYHQAQKSKPWSPMQHKRLFTQSSSGASTQSSPPPYPEDGTGFVLDLDGYPIPGTSVSSSSNVFLEKVELGRSAAFTLVGTVLARNLEYEKRVSIRFTTNEWKSFSDVQCIHVETISRFPPSFISDLKVSETGSWDRFRFSIPLNFSMDTTSITVWMAARYLAPDLGEWWDNNGKKNYRVIVRREELYTLPSLGEDVARKGPSPDDVQGSITADISNPHAHIVDLPNVGSTAPDADNTAQAKDAILAETKLQGDQFDIISGSKDPLLIGPEDNNTASKDVHEVNANDGDLEEKTKTPQVAPVDASHPPPEDPSSLDEKSQRPEVVSSGTKEKPTPAEHVDGPEPKLKGEKCCLCVIQ